jgi:hypothetical protein
MPRQPALIRCLHAIAWCTPLLLASLQAAADICKYVDRDGNLHYTNVAPEKGWKKLSCGVGGTPTPGEPETRSAPSPAGFPKVDAGTQKGRDDLRRKVLNEELATEEKLLAEARTAYGNGAPPATPDEQAIPQKYAERLARLRQAVSLHEKNIAALKKELAATR